MKYMIREATNQDAQVLCCLFKKHAEHEGQHLILEQQENNLSDITNSPVTIIVIEESSEIKGYMSLIKQFSTWDMAYYLYLDCLYLLPELRGKGLGTKLMDYCKRFASEHQLTQIQWQTPIENKDAIAFYNAIGAENKPKLRFFW